MKTKEAIQFCKTLKSLKVIDITNNEVTICSEILDKIIELLKRGEKFEAM